MLSRSDGRGDFTGSEYLDVAVCGWPDISVCVCVCVCLFEKEKKKEKYSNDNANSYNSRKKEEIT